MAGDSENRIPVQSVSDEGKICTVYMLEMSMYPILYPAYRNRLYRSDTFFSGSGHLQEHPFPDSGCAGFEKFSSFAEIVFFIDEVSSTWRNCW